MFAVLYNCTNQLDLKKNKPLVKSEISKLYLGNKISEFRRSKGLSQEALAELANLSLSTVQRIEKGTVTPRPFTLKILAEALELETSELLSHAKTKDGLKSSFTSLKRMNVLALPFAIVPFVNLIAPTIMWKKDEQILPKDNVAGKIVSFQLLWSVLTPIGIFIAIFLSNLLTGQAGDGLFIGLITYLLAGIFNIFTIAKTASQLNKDEKNILSFVPNLF